MPAFFIANVNVKNLEKFQQYGQQAAASMQPFEGQLLTKGALAKNLAGDLNYQSVAIVTFPDQAKLDAWFESDNYQALIQIRDEAADMLLTSFNTPS